MAERSCMRRKSKRKRSRIIVVAVAGALVFLASAGTTGAYLTHRPEGVINRMTPGKLSLGLTEPGWDPAEEKWLLPGAEAEKDPTVRNTGTTDAWMFLQVEIPVKNISLVDPVTKRKQNAAETELVQFVPTANWELVSREQGEGNVRYLYGYKEKVKPLQSTEPLFEKIVMVNYLEGALDAKERFQIPIRAMSIQSNVCSEGVGLKEIYEQYVKQQTGDER